MSMYGVLYADVMMALASKLSCALEPDFTSSTRQGNMGGMVMGGGMQGNMMGMGMGGGMQGNANMMQGNLMGGMGMGGGGMGMSLLFGERWMVVRVDRAGGWGVHEGRSEEVVRGATRTSVLGLVFLTVGVRAHFQAWAK